MFYLKSVIDTTKVNGDNQVFTNDGIKKQINKTGQTENIDELVKKQLEEEKKKPQEALDAFKNNDFEKALEIYGGLLKNDPGDPFVNYYYGVCLLKLDRNKAKAINSLLIASNVKEVPFLRLILSTRRVPSAFEMLFLPPRMIMSPSCQGLSS